MADERYDPFTDPEMQSLFARARRDGLWFYTSYQCCWFSPDELEDKQRDGLFCWGPVNWQLRSPHEYEAEIRGEVAAAERHLQNVLERLPGAGRVQR